MSVSIAEEVSTGMYTIQIDATRTAFRTVRHTTEVGIESTGPEITVMVAATIDAHDGRSMSTLLTGRYYGGAYVEVFAPWDEDPNGDPVHAIGVWNDRDDKPTIPCTVTAVTKVMTAYITDMLLEEVIDAR